jgi:putative phosphoribosyl transferase
VEESAQSNLPFLDRRAAGIALARVLRPRPGAVVLGVARGGVIVAGAVAEALRLPLDVVVVRKVGHPLQPELAIGAVASHGQAVATEHATGLPNATVQALFTRASEQASALEDRLRGETQPLTIEGRPAIVVDDGIATSATMMCAVNAVREMGASFVTCAVPVAPADCAAHLRPHCDELVVLVAPRELPFAVGRYYFMFGEVTDARVVDELARARERLKAPPS